MLYITLALLWHNISRSPFHKDFTVEILLHPPTQFSFITLTYTTVASLQQLMSRFLMYQRKDVYNIFVLLLYIVHIIFKLKLSNFSLKPLVYLDNHEIIVCTFYTFQLGTQMLILTQYIFNTHID